MLSHGPRWTSGVAWLFRLGSFSLHRWAARLSPQRLCLPAFAPLLRVWWVFSFALLNYNACFVSKRECRPTRSPASRARLLLPFASCFPCAIPPGSSSPDLSSCRVLPLRVAFRSLSRRLLRCCLGRLCLVVVCLRLPLPMLARAPPPFLLNLLPQINAVPFLAL